MLASTKLGARMQQASFGIAIKSVSSPAEAVKAVALLYRDDGHTGVIPHYFRIVGDRNSNIRVLIELLCSDARGLVELVYTDDSAEFLLVVNVLRVALMEQDHMSKVACYMLIDHLKQVGLLGEAENEGARKIINFKRDDEFVIVAGKPGQERVRKYLRYLKSPVTILPAPEQKPQLPSESQDFDFSIQETR